MNDILTLSAERQASPELLAALRQVDPDAVLIHMGDDEWWLGTVRPSEIRRKIGLNILAVEQGKPEEHRSPTNWRMGQLALRGFGLVKSFRREGAPGHDIVDWFRAADTWLRSTTDAEQEHELFDAAVEQERRHARALMRDYHATDARYKYARVLKQQRRVGWTPAADQPREWEFR